MEVGWDLVEEFVSEMSQWLEVWAVARVKH
jgi:hypothetical protein